MSQSHQPCENSRPEPSRQWEGLAEPPWCVPRPTPSSPFSSLSADTPMSCLTETRGLSPSQCTSPPPAAHLWAGAHGPLLGRWMSCRCWGTWEKDSPPPSPAPHHPRLGASKRKSPRVGWTHGGTSPTLEPALTGL